MSARALAKSITSRPSSAASARSPIEGDWLPPAARPEGVEGCGWTEGLQYVPAVPETPLAVAHHRHYYCQLERMILQVEVG